MNSKIVSVIVILVAVAAGLIIYYSVDHKKLDNLGADLLKGKNDSLQKFLTAQELQDYLKSSQMQYNSPALFRGGLGMMKSTDAGVMAGAPAPTVAEATNDVAGGSGATDYSHTNIQVAGVDESDFVKNDGKYIYVLSNGKLSIIDGYPAKDGKIVSTTTISGYSSNILLNGNKLVVFSQGNDETPKIAAYDFRPMPQYEPLTHIFIYDVSDKSNPVLVKNYTIDGDYYDSRMIGNYIYAISKKSVYYSNEPPIMPMMRESGKIVARPDIYYFGNYDNNYVLHTIASINLADDSVNAQTFLLGYSNTLYVSQDAIYLAYQKYIPYVDQQKNRFFDGIVPALPTDVGNTVKSIDADSSLKDYEKWDKIATELENMYNKMSETEKSDLNTKIENSLKDYDMRIAEEREKTIVHKIAINNGQLNYVGKGEVKGHLLNQFSMDENGDYFRIATTTGQTWNGESRNHLFVLDKDMTVVGKLEGLAQGERIYSVRFIGERAYMVTFKNTDPLFVIDLSDPTSPKVLGELKIPGYSDYLHPYDETHLIGLGKDALDGSSMGRGNFAYYQGVKLSLFDVSDVANPKEVSTFSIGDRGTTSEALYEHKAFLFSKEKNLLVIPIQLYEVQKDQKSVSDYGQMTFVGAYVFSLDLTGGFKLIGKISHGSFDRNNPYGYGYYSSSIRRSLYLDDTLYTISDTQVQANSLGDLSVLKSIKLPYEVPQPVYYGADGVVASSSAGSSGVSGAALPQMMTK